jgi:hypothetical protein
MRPPTMVSPVRVGETMVGVPHEIGSVGKKRCRPSHVMHLAMGPDTLTPVRAESLSLWG